MLVFCICQCAPIIRFPSKRNPGWHRFVRATAGNGVVGEALTLAAAGDELAAVLDELARHLEKVLGLIHDWRFVWCVWCGVVMCFRGVSLERVNSGVSG